MLSPLATQHPCTTGPSGSHIQASPGALPWRHGIKSRKAFLAAEGSATAQVNQEANPFGPDASICGFAAVAEHLQCGKCSAGERSPAIANEPCPNAVCLPGSVDQIGRQRSQLQLDDVVPL